jgi:hypothetical protein
MKIDKDVERIFRVCLRILKGSIAGSNDGTDLYRAQFK